MPDAPRLTRRRITAALIGLLVLVGGGWLLQNQVADDNPAGPSSESGLSVEPLTSLPEEATDTWRLIEAGGPFLERQDGTVFFNRERLLPEQDRGYYHEYTVPTPRSDDRGARRLVTGQADELYYTEDHYQSFVVVDPSR